MRRQERLGVWLTPTQTRIFDLVRRAGAHGIELQDVLDGHYTRDQIKAHVWRVNQELKKVGYRIVGTRGGDRTAIRYQPYCLIKLPATAASAPRAARRI